MNWFHGFQRAIDAKFSVSGYKSIDFSYQKSDTGPNEVQRQEALKLQLSGTAMQTTINADIQQSSTGTKEENKSQIEVVNRHFKVKLGEFRTHFATQALMQYQDTLDGAEAEIMGEGHHLGVIVSNPKGYSKKEQLQGNQSQGPFVLRFRPVVSGSESVFVEGQLQRKGQDYSLDYVSGEIRFLNRVIRSEERIVVTYETENLLYKDQVWGLKYGYTLPETVLGLYYFNKKETQSQGFAVFDQGLGVYKWKSGEWDGSHELSWSRRTDLLETQEGLAFFSKGGYQVPSLSVTVEALTASETFAPVSGTGVSPGDYRVAATGEFLESAARYLFSAKTAAQHYGDTQQKETHLQAGTTQSWQDRVWQGSIRHEAVSSYGVSGNALQAYQRQTGEASVALPLWGFPFSERLQVERKSVSIGNVPSFKSLASESRLEVLSLNGWQNIGEATLRWQHEAPSRSVEEQVLRWTSAYTQTPQNHIQAVVEQRHQTAVFPTTLANISAAFSPVSQWQQDIKLGLENLKEIYNDTETAVAKWDVVYNTSIQPFSAYETRYTYKTQFKEVDRRGLYPYANQEFSWDNRLGLWGAQWSFQRRERSQSRNGFAAYPVVVAESQGVTKTNIARFQNRPFPQMTWSLQGEFEDSISETAGSTASVKKTRATRLKSDLAMQIEKHTGGLTADIEDRETLSGATTTSYQGKYGTYFQFNGMPSMLRCEMAFTHYRDNGVYESYTPALTYTFRPSSGFDFSFRYSLERIFRASGTVDSPSWDLAVKAEFGRLVLTGTVLQAQKVGVPERFEAYLKMSYVF